MKLIRTDELLNAICDGDCFHCEDATCAGCMRMFDAMRIREIVDEIDQVNLIDVIDMVRGIESHNYTE